MRVVMVSPPEVRRCIRRVPKVMLGRCCCRNRGILPSETSQAGQPTIDDKAVASSLSGRAVRSASDMSVTGRGQGTASSGSS